MIPSKPYAASSWPLSVAFWWRSSTVSAARLTRLRKTSRSSGFSMKSYAPPWRAAFAVGHVAVGGDHDRLGLGLVLLGQLEHPQARGLALHDQIGDDHVEAAVPQLLLGLGQAVHDRADVTRLAQGLRP